MLKQLLFTCALVLLLMGCSKEECTKIIVIPEYRIGGGYYPEQKLEVPCSFEEAGPIEELGDNIRLRSKQTGGMPTSYE